jgi:4'-phosphopantetheinyl transferase
MTAITVRATVDLWFEEPRPASLDVLSSAERLRADAFESAAARGEFVASRTWLRTILAGYVGVPAASRELQTGRWGKPQLVGHDLEFSLSHARGLVLVAVSTEPVGVDIEPHRPGVWDPRATKLVLTPEEMKAVWRAADPDRAFLTLWTRKEAYAKVSGEGLVDRLTAVDLRAEPAVVGGVEVRSLDLGPSIASAIACSRGAEAVWRVR